VVVVRRSARGRRQNLEIPGVSNLSLAAFWAAWFSILWFAKVLRKSN